MPSFWKRSALAAFVAAAMSGWTANAQHPQQPGCAQVKCSQTGVPQEAWQPAHPSTEHEIPPQAGEPSPWVPGAEPVPPTEQPMSVEPTMPETTPEPAPPETPMPETTPEPAPIDTPADQAPTAPADTMGDLAFGSAQGGLGNPDVAFSGAPNMMGDLLRAYRGITFSYLQAGDFAVANTSGTVNFRNSKVAENNSAIPRDRISFRYNYFKEALQVDGLKASPELGPRIRQTPNTPFRQFHQVQPASKSYNVHLYTFGLEKTFLDNMASIEVRLPFARTIDSDLTLSSGALLFDETDRVPLVQPTPSGTLGDADTELQDMNVILKAILMQDPCQRWVISGGLGITIPTGEDLNARVVDYSNDVEEDIPLGDLVFPPTTPTAILRRNTTFAFDQRTREFRIKNQTWGLGPFLAAAVMPTERTFVNAFAQVDIPLNSSDWSFRERDVDLEVQFDPTVTVNNSPQPPGLEFVQYDRTSSGQIRDQYLLQLDLGAGYWFYRNPCHRHVKGLAGLLELHYTGTLDDADIVTVRETPIRTVDAGGLVGPLPPPRLGNIANRVDILNATMGSYVFLAHNLALGTAYVVPLRDGMDRTFDGELNVQLNWYH